MLVVSVVVVEVVVVVFLVKLNETGDLLLLPLELVVEESAVLDLTNLLAVVANLTLLPVLLVSLVDFTADIDDDIVQRVCACVFNEWSIFIALI